METVGKPTGDDRTIRYVGDLSRADAKLLAGLAAEAERILEYGVGASTQILAQAAAPGAEILGLDTEDYWIDRTRKLLDALAPGHGVRLRRFERLTELDNLATGSYDLIFDDGHEDLRLEFGLASWRLLIKGGRFVLHDTRRRGDVGNVLFLAARYFREIERIDLNPAGSNLSILHKCARKPYVDWNKQEDRNTWELGDDDLETTLKRLRDGR
jgi:predicted O-methyltransferase YrrM